MPKIALDAIDRKILKFLIKNARMPFLEIARECGISGAAIHQRIRKLDESGVILGSRLIVDPKMLGFDVCAHIGIIIKDPQQLMQTMEKLRDVPEIVECHFITGSYNITQIALTTAFSSIGNAKNNYSSKNYERFLEYRDIMTDRLQQKYDAIGNYPTTGFLSSDNSSLSGKPYDRQNGTVDKGSGDVMIPAFLAAYTGRDINKINTNPFLGILSIMPNWRVSYDGLSRIPWVKENFKSVSLTHAYTCKYSIGSYTSFSTWVSANNSDNSLGFIRDVQTENPLPSSAYDISSVSLTEQFSPLIGLNMTMKNSITAKAEYRKQRNLALNVSSAQMVEGATDEFVIGLGYTIKEFDLILKLKSNKQKKIKNDLKVSADVSYKDVKSILRKIEENVAQASSGNKVWSIKIMADYVLSSKINLQFFYDRQSTIPLISSSFPVATDNFGVNIKLMLTR